MRFLAAIFVSLLSLSQNTPSNLTSFCLAFVPLPAEKKLIGKAAIDGICSRLGKSGGSVVYQSLLLLFSTISASAPYVAVVLFSAIIIWVFSVRLLGKQFNHLTQNEAVELLFGRSFFAHNK